MSIDELASLDDVIKYVSDRISSITGVQLGAKQYTLVKSRLNKRLRELGVEGPVAYLEFLKKHESAEITALVSLLTTHHSFFFREFPHFEYLAKKGLQQICKEVRNQGRDTIRIWCAACSRGQEVYSLSMFLKYHLELLDSEMKFEILGTDISEECIEISKNGVYKWKEIKTIPSVYIGRHWARGTGDISAYVKAKASIKQHCKFSTLNLLDIKDSSELSGAFDIIFCRNVFIYFDQDQVRDIVSDMMRFMESHCQLYLGLSESLIESGLPLSHIGHSIYGKNSYLESHSIPRVPEFKNPNLESSIEMSSLSSTTEDIDYAKPVFQERSGPIRVLAVDDSPTVLKLVEKLLSKRPDFQLVATASNGQEATEKLMEVDVDVISLDIHMPIQNGLEYLEENFKPGHPPVVILSSVSREDANLAIKCLQAGASDYLEKPTLQNLGLIEDELCTKLLSAYELSRSKKKVTDLDMSFKRTPIIANPSKKIRIVFASAGDRTMLYSLLQQFRAPQPPTIVLFESIGNLVGSIKEEFSLHTVRAEELIQRDVPELESNRIYFGDASEFFESIYLHHMEKPASIVVLGAISRSIKEKSMRWRDAHVIVEDLSDRVKNIDLDELKFANQIVPITSLAYESDKFLSKEVDADAA